MSWPLTAGPRPIPSTSGPIVLRSVATGPALNTTAAPPVELPAAALDSRSPSPPHAHLARAPRLPPAGPWFWCVLTLTRRCCHRLLKLRCRCPQQAIQIPADDKTLATTRHNKPSVGREHGARNFPGVSTKLSHNTVLLQVPHGGLLAPAHE